MTRYQTVAVVLLLGLTASPVFARTWSSSNGSFTVEAEFVEARADGMVVLRRPDGKLIEAKADRLSQADQEFIRQQAQSSKQKTLPSVSPPAAQPEDAPPKKARCPDEAAQTKSRAKIKEAFAGKLSTKAPTELATKLLELAKDSNSDPTDRYVLLLEAANVASRGGKASLINEVVDELAAGYEGIDAHEKKTELFESAADRVSKDSSLKDNADSLTTAMLELEDEVLAADNYAAGKRLLDAVALIARKYRNEDILKQLTGRQKKLRDLRVEYQKVADSIATLKKEPNEPQANAVAGKYYALVKGDWKTAMPLLARGNDEKLKSAATLDQSQPSESAQQLDLADKWWELSELARGAARSQLHARAAIWYERALPTLDDALSKLKAQKRLAEARQDVPEQVAAPQNAAASAEVKLLLGTWQMRLPGRESAKWEFKKDGHVTSTQGAPAGTWRMENGRVMIRWDQDPQKQWASLVRPLNIAGIVGDNQSATLAVRGRKILEPNQARVPSRPRPQDLGVLLGRWQVKADDGYIATWEFHPSGIVTSDNNAPQGRWQLEERRVMIRWDRDPQKMWDTFERPLNPAGIVGDNWTGELVLRGQKLNPHAPK